MAKRKNYSGIETKLVRGGTSEYRSQFGEVSEALYLNSGFCYDSAETAQSRFDGTAPGFVYSRYLNPTLAMLEERLILLEEGAEACCVVGSGMAAVFASMMSFLETGDHVIASRVLFGSCHYIITQILPRFGISYSLVDCGDMNAWEQEFHKHPETACVFVETPANPTLEMVDITAVAALCKQHDAFFIVDNVFATPLYQQSLALGADAVIYSTTKHMDGQGRTLGGAILGSEQYIKEVVTPFHRHTGPALSPFNAWVILKGLETFTLRMERHTSNATAPAKILHAHPAVAFTYYPALEDNPQKALYKKQMKGGGGMLSFVLHGGKEAAFKFMNALEVIDIANNLGDAKSLITHPATTTHSNIAAAEREELGIGDGLLRLSVGIESLEDLQADVERGLASL